MRIGIDHRPALFGRGGIAVYVRELVAALAAAVAEDGGPADTLELYGHRLRRPLGETGPRSEAANVRHHESRLPAQALNLAARVGFGADRVLGDVDVLHLTDYVPLGSTRAPVVATVHDVLFEDVPACYPGVLRRRLRGVTSRIVRDAERLIVPSERSRAGLVRHFAADPARVHVIPHGCPRLPPADEAAAPPHGGEVYVLSVGTLQPRKNFETLVEALDLLHASGAGVRLVIAGARGWMDDALVRTLDDCAFAVHEADVSDERLAALYAGASLVVVPSLAEGFGFPVVEAMAMGVPVIVGSDTACAEVGGDAAIATDVRDPHALANAISGVLESASLTDDLRRAGRARAATFTWERTARETRRVYEQALQR